MKTPGDSLNVNRRVQWNVKILSKKRIEWRKLGKDA